MTPPKSKESLDETPVGDPPATVAAVDLGSNSFHMIMAQLFPGEVRVIDRQRERVRLAGGLQKDRTLDRDCRQRALDCLKRFGEQLKNLQPGHVRAVGTNTFRKARGAAKFTAECEAALGHPIDVISGIEEARLVYLGVVHTSPPRAGRRLVVDIGGGSTEVIIGDGTDVVEAESLGLGCVTYTHRYFPDGALTAKRFDAAITAARVELRPYATAFGPDRWDTCLGSSGTAHAIERIVDALGRDEGVTPRALARLRKKLIEAGTADAIDLPTLKADRRPVLPGGLAILSAVVESFGVERVSAVAGGLREGVLYDLHGRFQHDDVRDRTVWSFLRRFQVDEGQAQRVEATAVELWSAIAGAAELEDPYCRRLLGWSARLHEVGLAISHVGYHRHGEYLIRHARMDGFAEDDQRNLSILVRLHRKKWASGVDDSFRHLGRDAGRWLVVILRLAVLLNRSRDVAGSVDLDASVDGQVLTLGFDQGWLDARPVTAADLAKEASVLAAQGYDLVFRGR